MQTSPFALQICPVKHMEQNGMHGTPFPSYPSLLKSRGGHLSTRVFHFTDRAPGSYEHYGAFASDDLNGFAEDACLAEGTILEPTLN